MDITQITKNIYRITINKKSEIFLSTDLPNVIFNDETAISKLRNLSSELILWNKTKILTILSTGEIEIINLRGDIWNIE